MDILIVIDMQNDFIYGSLGSKACESIINNVCNYIKNFNGNVIFTKDCHDDNYLNTLEGINIPIKHCINGSNGCDIITPLLPYAKNIITKDRFASIELCEYLKNLSPDINSITLIGVCTDICVISNAVLLRTFYPNTQIKVVESCCAGVTYESHLNALEAMKTLMIEVV